jgi:mRNA-degrading endonuclease RelE of RelBE toxin-antitoxin system
MKWRIVFARTAEKELAKLSSEIELRIGGAIRALEHDPVPASAKRVKGREEFRLRVGDYRFSIFSITKITFWRFARLAIGATSIANNGLRNRKSLPVMSAPADSSCGELSEALQRNAKPRKRHDFRRPNDGLYAAKHEARLSNICCGRAL